MPATALAVKPDAFRPACARQSMRRRRSRASERRLRRQLTRRSAQARPSWLGLPAENRFAGVCAALAAQRWGKRTSSALFMADKRFRSESLALGPAPWPGLRARSRKSRISAPPRREWALPPFASLHPRESLRKIRAGPGCQGGDRQTRSNVPATRSPRLVVQSPHRG